MQQQDAHLFDGKQCALLHNSSCRQLIKPLNILLICTQDNENQNLILSILQIHSLSVNIRINIILVQCAHIYSDSNNNKTNYRTDQCHIFKQKPPAKLILSFLLLYTGTRFIRQFVRRLRSLNSVVPTARPFITLLTVEPIGSFGTRKNHKANGINNIINAARNTTKAVLKCNNYYYSCKER